MKKKIINILFNDFTNDNRVLKESRSLVKNGYDVELVATMFDKSLPRTETVEGIKVVRLKVGGFTSLPINLFLFWARIVKNYKREHIFHCNDLYALPPAYFIKKFFNKDIKIVYDCHEHETEAGIYIGRPILKFFAKVAEKMMIHSADRVITVSESIAQDYVSIYGIEKPYLVLNCPIYKEYENKDLFRKELGIPKNKVIFLYQGEYLPGRGVDKLIEVFGKLNKVASNICLILMVYGKGIEGLKEAVKLNDNIYWHDKVGIDRYMDYVASADWGIFLLGNTCKSYDFSLGNKLFDFIMGGLPVIVSNLKEMGNFVEINKIGYSVDLKKEDDIYRLLKRIDKQSREKYDKGLKRTANLYNWEKQEKELLRSYKGL